MPVQTAEPRSPIVGSFDLQAVLPKWTFVYGLHLSCNLGAKVEGHHARNL
jgi:hypothetical protein